PEKRRLALDALTSAPAYTWRIARLDDLLGDVSEKCGRLYRAELKKTTSLLGGIAKTAYRRTIYDLQVGTGTLGAAFDVFPESRITQILKMNWSGRNYSARIYADVNDMGTKLKQTLLEAMFTGESEHKIAEKVAQRWRIGYRDAKRLIRTETTYIANRAELESYKSAGIKEYTFTAVLDSRTSEVCAELDGKRFAVDKAKVGVNLPPMHPYCRSTTVAVIEDELFDLSDEELNEELGLNEDVSFEEWLSGLEKGEDGKVRYVGRRKNAAETVDFFGNGGIINIAKARDVFIFTEEQITANITPQEVLYSLEQSEIGKTALSHLKEMNIKPIMVYSKQRYTNRGEQRGNTIKIFMDNIPNVKVAAQTIIHETTHLYYDIGQSQWAEAVCMAAEKIFLTGKPLTIAEKRYIVKLAKAAYPEYNWIKGGYGHGRKKRSPH
ncbi:MAG: minor capsid protein, partial [Bacteroides sp.]|nr:minor capsid protein [Bacteroides sp.]